MQFLAGMKSYLVGAAMIGWAILCLVHPSASLPTMDANTASALIFGGLALFGIRSGLTTEIQKMLAALGVDVTANTTPSGVMAQGSKLVNALKLIASPAGSSKVAKVLVLGFALMATAPMLSGCQTYEALFGSTAAPVAAPHTAGQAIYQTKGVFAAALVLANGYAGLEPCPTNAPICKEQSVVDDMKAKARDVKTLIDAAQALVDAGLGETPDGQAKLNAAAQAASEFKTQAAALPAAK